MDEFMRKKIHLWPEEIVSNGDSITIGATIEWPGGKRQHLWYRLPAAYREVVTRSCDPFVLGMIFSIMKTSTDMLVHGQVSPSLLRNLVEFQDTWARWNPAKYRRIELSADVERETSRTETDEAILSFSGGGDSAYTAWHHRTGNTGRQKRNLVAGVMFHGFDIPLEESDVFTRAAEKSRLMLASLGMELIPIATNFREMGGTWEDAHGAGLASGLALLQGRYNTGLIAGGYDYANLIIPWGSNPITDGMLSSDSFQIIHDGAALDKLEKIRQIQEWPEALKYLRVCYIGNYVGNCCRCFKCVKIMMIFRMLGLGLPECFERDISNGEILRLRFPNLGDIHSGEKFIEQAKAASVTASWLRAFQFSIIINRLRLKVKQVAPAGKLARRIYRFFFPPF
jgi:hypothetical protein